MEIRFCSICNESIPDGEFDAGRAIVARDRAQHVACALQHGVRMGGTRSWLTFVLALGAGVISVFLLMRELQRPEGPPTLTEVPPVVEQHLAQALRDSESRLDAAISTQGRLFKEEFQTSLDARLTQHGATVKDATVGAMDELLRRSSDKLDSRIRTNNDLIIKLHQRLADMVEWKMSIQREADQLRRDLDAASQREPVAPVPAEEPVTPAVEPTPEPVDEAREKEIDRWIKRLRDSDEDIVFSATIELARLKALRAAPYLVEVLEKHKDFYARLGAATALGELQAVGSVDPLVEALNDKDDLVRTAASEALLRITGQDFNFVSGLTKNERIRIQKKYRAWWKDNETEVRQRLDQPAVTGESSK
ncbi:MAG: HEAT repeat domain-containing protein [Planctomycetota bacterium]|nr:HEAT repeat domain-containing protein [Planctomycetota bacterium]